MVAIRPKPGFIAGIGPENCPLEYRSLWEGFYSAVPLLLPREGNVQSTFLEVDTVGVRAIHGGVGGTDFVFALTPWGPGLEWISETVGTGIVVSPSFTGATGPGYLNMRGDEPFTAAVLFKWDGTTTDERAILSQGDNGGVGLRWRIANEASPADLLETSQVWFSNAITADRWYMLLLRAESDLTAAAQFDLLLYDYSDGTYVHDVQNTTGSHKGFDDPIEILGQSANDPANGLTLAGAWFWNRRLGMHSSDTTLIEMRNEVARFLADPFGMFELGEPETDAAAALTESVTEAVGAADGTTPVKAATSSVSEAVGVSDSTPQTDPSLSYIYPDGDVLSGGWETAPTPGQDLADQVDEDPPSDTDFIFEET